MYEIVTGTILFEELTSPVLYMKIMKGERPDFPSNVPDHLVKLISSCLDQSPEEKLTFDEIVNDELKNNESFITDSIDESNFLDFLDFIDNYQSTFYIYKKHVLFDDFIKEKRGDATLKKVYIEEH